MNLFTLLPNFREPVQLTIEYLTRVYSSFNFREQRMLLTPSPRLRMKFKVTTSDPINETFTKQYLFPIYTFGENGVAISGTRISFGSTHFYGTEFVKYVMSSTSYGPILAYTETTVDVPTAFSGIVYPAFLGHIKDISKEILTRTISEYSFEVEED